MSKISLGNFDRVEIYQSRWIEKVQGIHMIHVFGVVTILIVAIAATVVAHLQMADLYQVDLTSMLIP
jgi:hypothetical protein